jgi:hypothetical protein
MPEDPTKSQSNPEHVAVILAPGIFASHLVDPRGGLAWPANRTPAMLSHIVDSPVQQRKAFAEANAIRFLARGPSSSLPTDPPPDYGADSGWQDVLVDKYGEFLQACTNANRHGATDLPFEPHVFALGYNFTRSNSTTAWRHIAPQTLHILQKVRQKLNITDAAKRLRFIYVTHSMGALAVRFALKTNPALQKDCICVIHAAAPNAGAPETLMRFIRGNPKDRLPLPLIFGDQGWKCLTSASVIGAGFELLPFPMLRQKGEFRGFDVVTPADPDFHFAKIINTQFSATKVTVKLTTKEAGAPERNEPDVAIPDDRPFHSSRYQMARKEKDAITSEILGAGSAARGHLDAARAFHVQLGDYLFDRTGAVVLSGVETVQSISMSFSANQLAKVTVTQSHEGDGTVPVSSQKYLIRDPLTGERGVHFTPVVTRSGVEHVNALKKANPEDTIFAEIFQLMSRLYRLAPQEDVVKAPVTVPDSTTQTILAAFHGAGSNS